MVIAKRGIAATSHPFASQAAAQILAEGGSAADGAIAANAVLGVVEPMSCGIGGDQFLLYWEAKPSKLWGLNGSGPSPRGLSPELLVKQGFTSMPVQGIHSVTVPGAVDSWSKIHRRFGKLPWARLFAAAIAHAEEGYPLTESVAEHWNSAPAAAKLAATPEGARVFLPGGRAPREGEFVRNPDLAGAYRTIAADGSDTFYKGEIAQDILRTSQCFGGALAAEDLACYSAEFVEPISARYRDWTVYELPPNGQGMAALMMLNIMETQPPCAAGPFAAVEWHKRIEAMKLAYADLHRYNADPQMSRVPVAELLSKKYGQSRAALIDPGAANGSAAPGNPSGSDTIYLTVVDREGNVASWIQSIYQNFGSGITVAGKGFMLQNRGGGFTLDPGHPNVLAGGKRPFHTIIPGFMERGGLLMGFGIMGGPNQPQAHAQFVSNFVDYGMNVQQAMESPRFTKTAPAGFDLSIESRLPLTTLQELSALGHEIAIRRPYTQEMGRGQAILHDSATGINFAASDPRADGMAIPEPV
jgi:gamma-glutamyltranspeptidase/glutathione hydrolase